MTTLAFDTHEFVKELKGAGFSEQQAEIITKLQKAVINTTLEQAKHDYQLDDLVTRRDIKEMELELKRDIELLRLESKKDIELLRSDSRAQISEAKAELIRWVIGVGLLQTTLITGVLLKLVHLL